MTARVRSLLMLCFIAGLLLAVPSSRFGAQGSAPAADTVALSDDARRATFRFQAGTAPADRDMFLAAVASARPEARRLVALVDGLTVVRIGATSPGTLGVTRDLDEGWHVAVDLARVLRGSGRRGVDRVVLHELAHVVDRALVSEATMGALQAGIPAGWGCEQGVSGACAPPAERFAETFAKWATGDIGADLAMGYKVPPPSLPLDDWARPLVAVGA